MTEFKQKGIALKQKEIFIFLKNVGGLLGWTGYWGEV